MKNIILLLAVSLSSLTVSAQSGALTVTKATLTNTDTSYLKPNSPGASRWLSIQLNVTKVSGTTAGTASLQLSEDNVNWFPVSVAGVDTLTISNATISKRWEVGAPKSRYYRVRVYSTGTSVQTVAGSYYAQ